jgi:anti-anti-sigma factor
MGETIRIKTLEGRVFVWGELDAETAPLLLAVVAGLDGRECVLDLFGVTFADSAGLRSLVRLCRDVPGVSIDPSSVQGVMRRIMEITGVADFLLGERGGAA